MFVPTNTNHWYHEPACAESSNKWKAQQILALEAGLDPFEQRDNLALAKAAFGQKNTVLRRLSALHGLRDYIASEVHAMYETHPELRFPAVPAPGRVTPSKEEREIIVVASDWQFGKLQRGIGIDCMREERLPRLMDATRSIVEHFRDSGYAINKAHVVYAGDMIEGCYIFGGQNVGLNLDRTDNTHRITSQIALAAHAEASLVRDVASYVPEVEVHSVPGNHGRTNGKNEFSDPLDNFDTLTARWAMDKLAQQGNVKWQIEDDWFIRFAVAGHQVIAIHGDQWRGPVWKLENLVPGWLNAGAFGIKEPRLLITAHRHDFVQFRVGGTHVIQNGTIDGGSDWYLKAFGKASSPTQVVIVMSRRFGVEAVYPIYF